MNDYVHYKPIKMDSGLGVPYRPGVGSNGPFTYFDLKRNPELIKSVPELREHPELQSFVRSVNGSSSLFRTLRCEHRCTCDPANNGEFQCHWNFTFAFEIVEHNNSESYNRLNNLMEKFLRLGKKNDNLAYDIEPINTSYLDHNITLWSEDITVYGGGATPDKAESEFMFGLKLLEDFFALESSKWVGELAKGHPTIS